MTLSELKSGETLHKLLQQRWLIRLVNILLVVWVVWLATDAFWQHFRALPDTTITATPAAPPVTAPNSNSTDQVASWHLFGVVDEETTTIPERTAGAPETKLKLTLRGIYATDDPLEGFAIIQKPDKQEKHFNVGHSIFDLATLEEIYADHIIILRKGNYETLTLPEEALLFVPFAEKIRKEAEKRTMTNWRKKFVQRKGMDLIKMFGFEQAFKPGGFVGFRIKSLGKEGDRMLETLGLENGDIITAVNGKRFSESLEAAKSLKDLKTATEVDIEVDRGGVALFYHLEFEEENGIEDSSAEPVDTLKNLQATEMPTPANTNK